MAFTPVTWSSGTTGCTVDSLNIAARIGPLAEPGGHRVSEDVAQHTENKIEWPVRRLGKSAYHAGLE